MGDAFDDFGGWHACADWFEQQADEQSAIYRDRCMRGRIFDSGRFRLESAYCREVALRIRREIDRRRNAADETRGAT